MTFAGAALLFVVSGIILSGLDHTEANKSEVLVLSPETEKAMIRGFFEGAVRGVLGGR